MTRAKFSSWSAVLTPLHLWFWTFRTEDLSRSSLKLPRFSFQGRVSACGLQSLEMEQSYDSFLVLIIRQNGFCFSLLFALWMGFHLFFSLIQMHWSGERSQSLFHPGPTLWPEYKFLDCDSLRKRILYVIYNMFIILYAIDNIFIIYYM